MKGDYLWNVIHTLLEDNGYVILASDRKEFDFLMFGYRPGFKTIGNSRFILIFAEGERIGWNRLEMTNSGQAMKNISDPDSLTSLIEELS